LSQSMSFTPSTIDLLVFGGLSLTVDGRSVDVGPLRNRAVMSALVARGGWLATSDVVDLLWAGSPPSSATNQVQRIVGQLRRLFEPDLSGRDPGHVIASRGDSYALTLPAAVVDLQRFRAAQTAGNFPIALALAAGVPFADLSAALRSQPIFSSVERERVTAAVEALHPDPLGRVVAGAVDQALGLAEAHAFDERLHAALIVALAACGRRGEALGRFEACRRLLAEELGVDPGAELRRAHTYVLQSGGSGAPTPSSPLPAPPSRSRPRTACSSRTGQSLCRGTRVYRPASH
jgi:DNA-binding SARP family transcriptional activator